MWLLALTVVAVLSPQALSDTPANCTYEDIRGTWTFHIGAGGQDNTINCSSSFDVVKTVTVTLSYPDTAKDDQGNTGFWTIIYNQGFEVVVDDYKYFSFSNYTMIDRKTVVSYCHSTFNGWSHKVDESDWACYYGEKQSVDKSDHSKVAVVEDQLDLDRVYVKNLDFVNAINNKTKLWKAAHYPEYEGITLRDRLRRAGGVSHFRQQWFPEVATVRPETRLRAKDLPAGMDWRKMNGYTYVTPVRNQGTCGSCYAFASMAMLESRLMIASNGSMHKVFSPQDVVGCSEYSQGCEGGFPYLIAGKYAEDFGVVEEECFPYVAHDTKCYERSGCQRYMAHNYKYVGGYFGACNEQEMMMALQDGPVSVAFEVTDDFQQYRSGIYQHTGLTDSFNPFRLTNHAVLLVGYGEVDGTKYWIVKNSWGMAWGEGGYFRIIRGRNELNIESMAVTADPIVPK